MKTIELTCSKCNKLFTRSISEHNRNIKKGRKVYCSNTCAGKDKTGHLKDCPKYDLRGYSRVDKYTPIRYAFGKAKQHAQNKNMDFDITLDDVFQVYQSQNGRCVFTGWEIDTRHRNRNDFFGKNRLSIDRIDSSIGYTKDNIQLVCVAANIAKSVHSNQDLIDFCIAVVENNGYIVSFKD